MHIHCSLHRLYSSLANKLTLIIIKLDCLSRTHKKCHYPHLGNGILATCPIFAELIPGSSLIRADNILFLDFLR
jgi:hypothetical protein